MEILPTDGSSVNPTRKFRPGSSARPEPNTQESKSEFVESDRTDSVDIRESISRENELAASQILEDEEKAAQILQDVKSQIESDGEISQEAQGNIDVSKIINIIG